MTIQVLVTAHDDEQREVVRTRHVEKYSQQPGFKSGDPIESAKREARMVQRDFGDQIACIAVEFLDTQDNPPRWIAIDWAA